MLEGIVIGGAGGTIAGLAIWLIQLLKEKVTERADKKRVYNCLSERTKLLGFSDSDLDDPHYWISTIDIGVYTNLTPDRVQYICRSHKKIIPKKETYYFWHEEPLKEKWGIREFVNSQGFKSLRNY